MYNVDIVTEYNTIHLEVEDINSKVLEEIFNQDYVLEIYINNKLIYLKNKGKSL